ncbi:MAG: hypothetical protein ACI9GZ_002558 [Bacteroidia bacterium]|jgi:hypothetical protein
MRIAIIFILTLIALPTLAQKEIDTLTGDFGSYYYDYITQMSKQLNLKEHLKSKDSVNLRIWFSNAVLDIKSNKSSIAGNLYIFVWKTNKNEGDQKLVYVRYELGLVDVDSIVSRFYNQNINEFKDSDLIENYPVIMDGETYTFEHSTPDSYKFFSYGNPQSADGIMEAEIIDNYVDYIRELTFIPELYKKFEEELSPGIYRNGRIIVWKAKQGER